MPLPSTFLTSALPSKPSDLLVSLLSELSSSSPSGQTLFPKDNVYYGSLDMSLPNSEGIGMDWPVEIVEHIMQALQIYILARTKMNDRFTNLYDDRTLLILRTKNTDAKSTDLLNRMMWNLTDEFLKKLGIIQQVALIALLRVFLRSKNFDADQSEQTLSQDRLSNTGSANRRQNRRTPFTVQQESILLRAFELNNRPSILDQRKLAVATDLSPKQIQTWFINKRTHGRGPHVICNFGATEYF